MAREDVLPQLIRTMMQKEGPPAPDDNSILQKMIIPYDTATLTDSMTISSVPITSRIWGTFIWSMSQWGNVVEHMIAPQDTATVSDSIEVTRIPYANAAWGNFAWTMNTWWIPGTQHNWQSYQNTSWNSFGNTTWSGM